MFRVPETDLHRTIRTVGRFQSTDLRAQVQADQVTRTWRKIEKLWLIFANNGYPLGGVIGVKKRTLNQRPRKFGPRRCHIYLLLPWIGTGR